MVKNLPAKQETWVRSLGWEDPRENGYPLQYSWTEDSPWGCKESARLSDFRFLQFSVCVSTGTLPCSWT